MKHIAILFIAATVVGCAGVPGQSEPPRYDASQQAIIAPGYPVERIDRPSGFQHHATYSDQQRKEYDRASSQGSALQSSAVFGWSSRKGEGTVMTSVFESVNSGSRFLPAERSDGYEFVAGQKIIYLFREGHFADMSGDASLIPSHAPDCASAVDLLAESNNSRYRFIGIYAEGVPCNELGGITGRERQALKERAYQAYGLK